MDLVVQRARRMSRLRGDGGVETLHVLAHVRQDDTPEHDIRRPWAPTEREDGTRPILVSHPSDLALKTVRPASISSAAVSLDMETCSRALTALIAWVGSHSKSNGASPVSARAMKPACLRLQKR